MKSRILRFSREAVLRGEVFRDVFEQAGWSKPRIYHPMFRYQGPEFIGEFTLAYSASAFSSQDYYSNACFAVIDPLWKKHTRKVKQYYYERAEAESKTYAARFLKSKGDKLAQGQVLFDTSGDPLFKQLDPATPLLLLTDPGTINHDRFEEITAKFAAFTSEVTLEWICDYLVEDGSCSMYSIAGMLGSLAIRNGRDAALHFLNRIRPKLIKNYKNVEPVIVVAELYLDLDQTDVLERPLK